MNLQYMTDEFAEVVGSEIRSGKLLHQIAGEMQVSVDVAACAFVRYSVLHGSTVTR